MPDIFLSYNRDDAAIARRFAEGLERQGLSVWWDATLRSGEAYDEVTEQALADAKAVVVLWSAKSVGSRWVRAEATEAMRNKTLVPVMIEACKRPIMFELTQTADLSQWNGDPADKDWQAFVADVRSFVEGSAPRAGIALPAHPTHSRRVLRGRLWAALAVTVAVAAGAVWVFTRNAGVSAAASSGAATAQTGATSIAVLPFADMSPERDQDYFSDGLSEELLNQLALIRNLQVAGRTSSFSFKGKGEDLKIIGSKLGVEHLLDGSVRKAGQQLRITAELINASTGLREWSRTYDRKLEDVFAVQEEIAKDVAGALSVKLGVGEMPAGLGRTTNVAAWEKYLRGRALIERGGPDHQRGIDLYREAVVLDPRFARAWTELYLELRYSLVFNPANPEAIRREMAQASERAVALAPDAWWTQAMLTQQLRSQHRWMEAEAAAKRAVAAASATEVDALRAYAEFLNDVGRVGDALPLIQQMRDADPLSLRVSGLMQIVLRSSGRTEDAEREYQRSKDLAGSHAEWEWYALLRLWSRQGVDPAVVAKAVDDYLPNEDGRRSVLRELRAHLEDPARARAILRQKTRDPSVWDSWTQVTGLALVADHFGDRDLVLEALARRLELTDFHYIAWWPYETDLRRDPRFRQIVRNLKLDEYWRGTGKWGDFCEPVGRDDFQCL